MKEIEFKKIDGTPCKLSVGKRATELSQVLDDIIVEDNGFLLVYGSFIELYRNIPFSYSEMHATKNPYPYKGRKD